MRLADVNVLINAHRTEAIEHARYAHWLRTLAEGPEPFAIAEYILSSFLRIVTHPSALKPPTAISAALRFCRILVERPNAVLVAPGPRHWPIFARLCEGIRGPLVTNAYIAALAIEHGCELVSADRDFARFEGLRWRHPFA